MSLRPPLAGCGLGCEATEPPHSQAGRSASPGLLMATKSPSVSRETRVFSPILAIPIPGLSRPWLLREGEDLIPRLGIWDKDRLKVRERLRTEVVLVGTVSRAPGWMGQMKPGADTWVSQALGPVNMVSMTRRCLGSEAGWRFLVTRGAGIPAPAIACLCLSRLGRLLNFHDSCSHPTPGFCQHQLAWLTHGLQVGRNEAHHTSQETVTFLPPFRKQH